MAGLSDVIKQVSASAQAAKNAGPGSVFSEKRSAAKSAAGQTANQSNGKSILDFAQNVISQFRQPAQIPQSVSPGMQMSDNGSQEEVKESSIVEDRDEKSSEKKKRNPWELPTGLNEYGFFSPAEAGLPEDATNIQLSPDPMNALALSEYGVNYPTANKIANPFDPFSPNPAISKNSEENDNADLIHAINEALYYSGGNTDQFPKMLENTFSRYGMDTPVKTDRQEKEEKDKLQPLEFDNPFQYVQGDAYRRFLNTDAGQEWLAKYAGRGYDDAGYGFENLRGSHDTDAWLDLIPLIGWEGLYQNDKVDYTDRDSFNNYMWGPEAIQMADYLSGNLDWSKLGTGSDFDNMAKYLAETNEYMPQFLAYLNEEAGGGIDINDAPEIAAMLGISNGTYAPTRADANRQLGLAGDAQEIGLTGNGSEYSRGNRRNSRAYGVNDSDYIPGYNVFDVNALDTYLDYLDKTTGKEHGVKQR